MNITGAVLEECGRPGPYEQTLPLSVGELQLASPQQNEVLVRMEAAGVCHSDLSVINGDRVRQVPMVLGHEACGILEEVGDGVDLQPGQRVVIVFQPRCGECEACRVGGRKLCTPGNQANSAGLLMGGGMRLQRQGQPVHHHSGVSGFATHSVLHRSSVIPIPQDVPAHVGALLGCAVLTGGGAVKNAARIRAGETVVVFGAGGVGLAAALVASALGASRVTVIDPIESKHEVACKIVADEAMTPQEAVECGLQADIVIEATGNAHAFEQGIETLAPGGRLVAVGLGHPADTARVNPLGVVSQSKTIIGSYLGSGDPVRDVPEYVELWKAGRLPVERLVSATVGLREINRAMDDLAAGRALRQIVDFSIA
ncbi:alcohol dehydrogenase catalytic domain-containing protein [Leucobacter sp. HY1910]